MSREELKKTEQEHNAAMDLLRTANRNMEKKLRAASHEIFKLDAQIKKEKAKNKKK